MHCTAVPLLSFALINNTMGHYYCYVGSDSSPDNWSSHSDSAGNPHIPYVMVSKSSIATSVFKEVLGCYRKVVAWISFSYF
uniref:Secreted protein n=1 Tax=Aegilops tauschii subsp. strangulata TaxID=200361 RepID=A0A453BMH3_AEGTS